MVILLVTRCRGGAYPTRGSAGDALMATRTRDPYEALGVYEGEDSLIHPQKDAA